METQLGSCPLTQRQVIDEYFIEHRTQILDIAAFLDRLDRARAHDAEDDFRLAAFRQALHALCTSTPDRAETIQMIFSDPTTEPLEQLDRKGAYGAYHGREQEVH